MSRATSPSAPDGSPPGTLVPPVNRDCNDGRRGEAEAAEEGGDVGGLEAAAELEDADGLAGAVQIFWEAVERSDLEWGQAGLGGVAAHDPAGVFGAAAHVRAGDRPGVEPEHRLDAVGMLRRYGERAPKGVEVRALPKVLVGHEGYAERCLHV